MDMTKEQIIEALSNYNGSEKMHRHLFGGLYTDGVKAMAEMCEAFWLIDLVFSHQNSRSILKIPDPVFQVWTLELEGEGAVAKCSDGGRDGNDEIEVVMQRIPYTDFPLDSIKFYLIDGVLLLPSEY
jgi:hypothetical protein